MRVHITGGRARPSMMVPSSSYEIRGVLLTLLDLFLQHRYVPGRHAGVSYSIAVDDGGSGRGRMESVGGANCEECGRGAELHGCCW